MAHETPIEEIRRKIDPGAKEIFDEKRKQMMYYLPKTEETLTLDEVIGKNGISLKNKFRRGV
ncbi:hypothetical protein [Geomicrobium sediminis]|uniref:Uncharacterized protein n=1 Tax=Geomicrobium sediminis TaxID=1347788 RepID=A0ABS2P8L0_9BACL|nr:hypothetical protein [Geomicrobium sediminis]MBM7631748.1 hypothetical protein [Geomicrobium sediminis]